MQDSSLGDFRKPFPPVQSRTFQNAWQMAQSCAIFQCYAFLRKYNLMYKTWLTCWQLLSVRTVTCWSSNAKESRVDT
eukprot:1161992-Pelagomonas_calceolata.AAC.3